MTAATREEEWKGQGAESGKSPEKNSKQGKSRFKGPRAEAAEEGDRTLSFPSFLYFLLPTSAGIHNAEWCSVHSQGMQAPRISCSRPGWG